VTPRARAAGAAVLAVGLLGVTTSCSAGSADASSRVSALSSDVAPTTTQNPSLPSTSPGSSLPSTSAARSTDVSAASSAVTAALFTLTERSRALTNDKALAPARKTAAEGLTSARSHLAAERRAAYGGVRSCSSVVAHASSARSASARAASGRSAALVASTRLRAEVAGLDKATAAVASALVRLRSALAGTDGSGSSVPAAEVENALTSAKALRTAVLDDITNTGRKTSQASADASRVAASAASIANKTC
jgi:hypothetical protein